MLPTVVQTVPVSIAKGHGEIRPCNCKSRLEVILQALLQHGLLILSKRFCLAAKFFGMALRSKFLKRNCEIGFIEEMRTT